MTTPRESHIPPFAGLALGYMTLMYFGGMGLFWLIKGEPPLLAGWIIWLPLSVAGGLCYAPIVRANARKRLQRAAITPAEPEGPSLPANEHRAA